MNLINILFFNFKCYIKKSYVFWGITIFVLTLFWYTFLNLGSGDFYFKPLIDSLSGVREFYPIQLVLKRMWCLLLHILIHYLFLFSMFFFFSVVSLSKKNTFYHQLVVLDEKIKRIYLFSFLLNFFLLILISSIFLLVSLFVYQGKFLKFSNVMAFLFLTPLFLSSIFLFFSYFSGGKLHVVSFIAGYFLLGGVIGILNKFSLLCFNAIDRFFFSYGDFVDLMVSILSRGRYREIPYFFFFLIFLLLFSIGLKPLISKDR